VLCAEDVTNAMGMVLVSRPISIHQLREVGAELFGDMVKGVVDIEKEIMAIGAELHADEEAFLLEHNSKQENLWGINLYPERKIPEMVEFDSLINIRPRQNNRSRGIEDPALRDRILNIVSTLID